MISSIAAIIPVPFLGSYCATKASITKLTECLNLEQKLLKTNIDIVLVEPGLYHTGFNQFMLSNYDINNIFKNELELIEKENKLISFLEYRNYDTIVNKIYKAITTDKPNFLYRAPFMQFVGRKIYQLFLASLWRNTTFYKKILKSNF